MIVGKKRTNVTTRINTPLGLLNEKKIKSFFKLFFF